MDYEPAMVAELRACCPRVFADVAPWETLRPYVTWQQIGGVPQRYLDNTSNLRHAMVQINVWAETREECTQLSRAIEARLCAASAFRASPDSEPIADFDTDTGRRGARQDFSIWSASA